MNKLWNLGNEVVRLRQKLDEMAPLTGVLKIRRTEPWADFCAELLELMNEICLNAEPAKINEDKKSVRYFTCEMTDNEYQEFLQHGKCQSVKHKMEPVEVTDPTDESHCPPLPEEIIKYYNKALLRKD